MPEPRVEASAGRVWTFGPAVMLAIKRLEIEHVEAREPFSLDVPQEHPAVFLTDDRECVLVTALKGRTGQEFVVIPKGDGDRATLLESWKAKFQTGTVSVTIGPLNRTATPTVRPERHERTTGRRKNGGKKRGRKGEAMPKAAHVGTPRNGLREGCHPALVYACLLERRPKKAMEFPVVIREVQIPGLTTQQVWNAVMLLKRKKLLTHGPGKGEYIVHMVDGTAPQPSASVQHLPARRRSDAQTLAAARAAQNGELPPVAGDLRRFARQMLVFQGLYAKGYRVRTHHDGAMEIYVPAEK